MQPTSNNNASFWNQAVVAQAAAMTAYGITHPLWVLKAREQVSLPKTLNPRILYRGLTASLLASPFFTVQAMLVAAAERRSNGKLSPVARIAATSMASLASFTVSFPIEQTILQMQNSQEAKPTICTTAQKIYRTQGIRGFYAGGVALGARETIWALCYFNGEKALRERVFPKDTRMSHLISGSIAGLGAWGLSQVPDLVGTIRQHDFQREKYPDYASIFRHLRSQGACKTAFRGSRWRLLVIIADMSTLSAGTAYFPLLINSSGSHTPAAQE